MTKPTSQLDAGAIELLFCDMRSALPRWRGDLAMLHEEERARAARFHFERDRAMFVCCRAALRRTVARYTGQDPASIRFTAGACGKPALAGGAIEFNVSHAGHWFACAVSVRGVVGVDIEQVHPLRDMLAVAQHFFAPAEVERLFALPEPHRLRSFFECWTRKEAVIKATGEGVSRPLDSFEVAFGPGSSPALLRFDDLLNPEWGMQSFAPAEGYVAALTTPGTLGSVNALIQAARC